MRARRWVPLILLLVSAACFHQIARTGLTPGNTVVNRPWVTTWFFGLVPARDVDVSQQCPKGVAIVETQQSFLNGLVGALTIGVYTPQTVRVTCASGSASLPTHSREITVAQTASAAERADALRRAIEQSVDRHETVIVRF